MSPTHSGISCARWVFLRPAVACTAGSSRASAESRMIGKVTPGSTTPVFLEMESRPWCQLQALLACLEATSVGLTSRDQLIKVVFLQPWGKPDRLFVRCQGPPCGQHQTPNLSDVGSLTPGTGSIWSLAGAVFGAWDGHLARKRQEG